jgi:hypothetical protein
MGYYALYENNSIKAVFSTLEIYNKWVRILYHPIAKQKYKKKNTMIKYHCVVLDSLLEDENYSIYLMQTKTDKEIHYYYSTVDEVKKAVDDFIKINSRPVVVVLRIIIDYPYKPSVIEDTDIDAVIFNSNGAIV